MRRNIAKRTWGVLGKQQTFYSPGQFIENKPKVPLNNTPVDAWDYKKSKYYRIDLVPIEVQQGGTVIGQDTTPVVSPTPSITPTATPGLCKSYTFTNTGSGPSFVYDYTDCFGVVRRVSLPIAAPPQTICAIAGSLVYVGGTGTVTDNGICNITPTPSPTPSSTPLPATWDTYNVQWNNANTNWNNA